MVLRQAEEVTALRVLVIDSYDSFVYNLVQYIGELGADPIVVRNDQLTVDEALALEPDAVLLSPGPGRPEDAGIICAVVPAFAERGVPVLGVCLGHQAIGHVYGGSIVNAPSIMHGKTSPIEHRGVGMFHDLPSPLTATRYHSLVIDPSTMPACLGRPAPGRTFRGTPVSRPGGPPAGNAGRAGSDGPWVRLFVGGGRSAGLRPGDLVGAITNEAHVPGSVVGAIQINEGVSFVDVQEGVADAIVLALREATIRGRRLQVRRDQ